MSCGHCVNVVTRAVKGVDPAAALAVDLALKRAWVRSDRAREELIRAPGQAGYPATPA